MKIEEEEVEVMLVGEKKKSGGKVEGKEKKGKGRKGKEGKRKRKGGKGR